MRGTTLTERLVACENCNKFMPLYPQLGRASVCKYWQEIREMPANPDPLTADYWDSLEQAQIVSYNCEIA